MSYGFRLNSAAFAVSLILSACGGGGGDSGANNSTAPASVASAPSSSTPVNTNVAPVTSVPAATYDPSSGQIGMYQAINDYRKNVGVGLVAQNNTLDTAAQAHAVYVQSNFNSGVLNSLVHSEESSNASFYASTPYQRGQKAGAPADMWIGEEVAAGYSPTDTLTQDGVDCASQWINTVYHLQGITDNFLTIGMGFVAPSSNQHPYYFCVADGGTISDPAPADATLYNTNPLDGGQQLPAGTLVHVPYANESNVAVAMVAESTNPAPDLPNPGRPIMVRVNAQTANKLTVTNFQLTDAAGAPVAARVILPTSALSGSMPSATADVNNNVRTGVAFLLPLKPLLPNAIYNVNFSGARDGVAIASAWTFSTAAK